jgi:predicted nucleic acid-binding protein
MRETMRMIVNQWKIQSSWVLEFMNVLKSWLEDWSREKNVNKLREEIEELMRKNEIDEQLDEIQDLLC